MDASQPNDHGFFAWSSRSRYDSPTISPFALFDCQVLDVPDTMVDSWFQNALMRGDQAFSSSLVGYVRPVKVRPMCG